MVILRTETLISKIVFALLIAVLAITLWMAWHYQKSASMMQSGVEAILESFKVERAQRVKIESKLEGLERRVKSLEGKTASPLENQPK